MGAYFFAGDGRAARKSEKGPGKGGSQAVLITSAVVQARTLEIYEEVVGTIENVIDPTIGAEVAGRVTRVAGFTGKKVAKGELIAEIDAADFHIQARADQAEIGRLTSLLEQQERVVERNKKLVGQGFISQNAIDDAIAQRNALRQQLAAARARAEATGRGLTKSRVLAPVDGEIETQIVAIGDYVKVGDPLFKLVGRAAAAGAFAAARGCRDAHQAGAEGGAVAPRRARATGRSAHRRDQADVRRQQSRDRRDRQDQRRGHRFPRRRHGQRDAS